MRISLLAAVAVVCSVLDAHGQATPRYCLGRSKSPAYPCSWSRLPLVRDNLVGLNYGTRQRVPGVTVHSYLQTPFKVPLFLDTDVKWRTPKNGSTYFNLALTQHLLSMGIFTTLSPAFGYKRVASAYKATDQLYLGVGLWQRPGGVTVAYARQHQPVTEGGPPEDQGIMLQLHMATNDSLYVKLSGTYWFNEFQYSLSLTQRIFWSSFYISAGYEKIRVWNELDICLLYNL